MDILSAYGYPTIGLPLPSVGAKPPNMTFDEGVNAIRGCLVDTEEKEVILVEHSAGVPGVQASKGLGKKELQGKTLKGRDVRLVFIMAPKDSHQTLMPGWMEVDLEVG